VTKAGQVVYKAEKDDPHALQPNLGHAHQVGLRDRPPAISTFSWYNQSGAREIKIPISQYQ
jgi:hypothetical protein